MTETKDAANLGRIWVSLNCGEWPSECGPCPAGGDEPGIADEARHKATIQLMNEICDAIGMKECLRAWNVPQHMTDAQFEWWWTATNEQRFAMYKTGLWGDALAGKDVPRD